MDLAARLGKEILINDVFRNNVGAAAAIAGIGAYKMLRGTRNNYAASIARADVKRKLKRTYKGKSKFVQRTRSVELKNFDYVATNSNCVTLASGTGVLVNPITAGTGVTQMIGRKAVLKSLQFRISVHALMTTLANLSLNASNGVSNGMGSTVRVMFVYDKDPNGALVALSEVLTSINNMTLAAANLSNTSRFTVLYDERNVIGPHNILTGNVTYSVVSGPSACDFSKYLKLNLDYEGPATIGITGINHGAIYYYVVSDQHVALSFDSFVRIRFADA